MEHTADAGTASSYAIGTIALKNIPIGSGPSYLPNEIIHEILRHFLRAEVIVDVGARSSETTWPLDDLFGRSDVRRSNFWQTLTPLHIEDDEHWLPVIRLVKKTFLEENTILAGRNTKSVYAIEKIRDYQLLHLLVRTPHLLDCIRSPRLDEGFEDEDEDDEHDHNHNHDCDNEFMNKINCLFPVERPSKSALLIAACVNLNHVILPIKDAEIDDDIEYYEDFEAFESFNAEMSGLTQALTTHPTLQYIDLDFVGKIGLQSGFLLHDKMHVIVADDDWVPHFYRNLLTGTDIQLRFIRQGTKEIPVRVHERGALEREGLSWISWG